MILARANAGQRVVLTADTACFVGVKLRTASKKPTRDDVARLICKSKCSEICYACLGVANVIANAYGESVLPCDRPDDCAG